jgi:hypothetical protein
MSYLMVVLGMLAGMVLEDARQRLRKAMAVRRLLYGPLGRQLLRWGVRHWPAPYRGWASVSSRVWMWTHRQRIRSFESGRQPILSPTVGDLYWPGHTSTPEQALAFRAHGGRKGAICQLLNITPDGDGTD